MERRTQHVLRCAGLKLQDLERRLFGGQEELKLVDNLIGLYNCLQQELAGDQVYTALALNQLTAEIHFIIRTLYSSYLRASSPIDFLHLPIPISTRKAFLFENDDSPESALSAGSELNILRRILDIPKLDKWNVLFHPGIDDDSSGFFSGDLEIGCTVTGQWQRRYCSHGTDNVVSLMNSTGNRIRLLRNRPTLVISTHCPEMMFAFHRWAEVYIPHLYHQFYFIVVVIPNDNALEEFALPFLQYLQWMGAYRFFSFFDQNLHGFEVTHVIDVGLNFQNEVLELSFDHAIDQHRPFDHEEQNKIEKQRLVNAIEPFLSGQNTKEVLKRSKIIWSLLSQGIIRAERIFPLAPMKELTPTLLGELGQSIDVCLRVNLYGEEDNTFRNRNRSGNIVHDLRSMADED